MIMPIRHLGRLICSLSSATKKKSQYSSQHGLTMDYQEQSLGIGEAEDHGDISKTNLSSGGW